MASPAPRKISVLTMVVVIVLVGGEFLRRYNRGGPGSRQEGSATSAAVGADTLAVAFQTKRSDLIVEAAGAVDRILNDDREGSRHQRFIVRLSSGQTVLVAHNIDLAPRVPVNVGESVEFRGEYEWNERGGVIHWTHRDPGGKRKGGWIRYAGKVYR